MKKFFLNFINLFKPFPNEKVIEKGCQNNSGDETDNLINDDVQHNSSESFRHCQSGDGISQREYAALYAKACLYRGLAYGLAKKYDPSSKEMINSISHIDGKNV